MVSLSVEYFYIYSITPQCKQRGRQWIPIHFETKHFLKVCLQSMSAIFFAKDLFLFIFFPPPYFLQYLEKPLDGSAHTVPGKIFSRCRISIPLFWLQRGESVQAGDLSAVASDAIPGEM